VKLLGVSGTTHLSCAVTAEGGLSDCRVVDESPAGWGYGNAASKLAPVYRLKTASTRSASARVTVRIEFPAAEFAPSPPPTVPRSADSMATSLRVVGRSTMTDTGGLIEHLRALSLFAPRHLQEPLRDSISRSEPAFIEAVRSELATQMAVEYSDDELKFLDELSSEIDLDSSPAKIDAALLAIKAGLRSKSNGLAAAARDIFCASRDCRSSPPPITPPTSPSMPATPRR
jgi:hypothetical protein